MESDVVMTLVELPTPCLQRILQLLMPDTLSVSSAARAHSRLQQASVVALSSIYADATWNQAKQQSLLQYVRKHCQHISSMDLWGLQELNSVVPCPKLQDLHLSNCSVQLTGQEGLLHNMQQLTVLELYNCRVQDSSSDVAAALSQLPSLQHLTIEEDDISRVVDPVLSRRLLSGVTALTSLQLSQGSSCSGPADFQQPRFSQWLDLQDLQDMPHLQQLYLSLGKRITLRAVSAAQQLTLLDLSTHMHDVGDQMVLDPAVFTSCPQLRHLRLVELYHSSYPALLSEIGKLQQLTFLFLTHGLDWTDHPDPEVRAPVTAYTAFTASSKLQRLQLHRWPEPQGQGWEYIFPSARQLSALTDIHISNDTGPPVRWTEQHLQRLARSCPNLQRLALRTVNGDPLNVQPLTALSQLTRLTLQGMRGEGLLQLTQLKEFNSCLV